MLNYEGPLHFSLVLSIFSLKF